MNWLIDGAYGDLYRKAMHLPEHRASRDEWEEERRRSEAHRDALEPPVWASVWAMLAVGLIVTGAAFLAVDRQSQVPAERGTQKIVQASDL